MRQLLVLSVLSVFAILFTGCSESVEFAKNQQNQVTGQSEGETVADNFSDPSDDQPDEGEPFNPQPPILVINQGDAYTQNQNVNLEISAVSTEQMYISNDPTCSEGGQWQNYNQNSQWDLANLNTEASVYAKVRYIDGSESDCVSDSIIHDNIAPVINYNNNEIPVPLANYDDAQFGFQVIETGSGVDTIQCQIDSAELADCTDNYAAMDLADGPHSMNVMAVDKAGNSAQSLYPWVIDTIAPSVTIENGPGNPTAQDTGTFAFVSDDPQATFTCWYDDVVSVPCITGFMTGILDDGNHNFYVRATDAAGNSSAPVQYPWLVDLVDPVVNFTQNPDAYSNNTAETILFQVIENGSGIDNVQCYFDESLIACPDMQTIALDGLTDGPHSVRVVATDNVGRTGDRSLNWVVDTMAPVVVFDQLPDPVTMNTSEVVTYHIDEDGSGLDSFQCYLDSNLIDCPILGTINLDDLGLGPHNIQVVATDRSGLTGANNYSWTIESAPNCQPEQFQQPDGVITNLVDILFVVDSSISLNDEREDAANAIGDLIAELPEGIDFRIAVLFGHAYTSHTGRLFQTSSDKPGDREPVVISSDLTDAEIQEYLLKKLESYPQDNGADGGEAMLYSLHELVNGSKLATAKEKGFFRDNAALSVIVVTDENDICVPGLVVDDQDREPVAYQEKCVANNVTPQSVYDELVTLQDGRPLLIGGIFYNGENPVPSVNENEYGFGIDEFVALNNGVSVDLAVPGNIPAGLSAIGEMTSQILQLMTEFQLQETPTDPTNLSVTVDGVAVEYEFIAPMTVRLDIEDAGQANSIVIVDACAADSAEGGEANGAASP